MRKLLFLLIVCFYCNANAQELFVFTEPASNMADAITINEELILTVSSFIFYRIAR